MNNNRKSKPEPATSLMDSNAQMMQQENDENFSETDIIQVKQKKPLSKGLQKVGAHLMGRQEQHMEMMPSDYDSDD